MVQENVPQINPPPEPSTPRLAPWQHVEVLIQKLDKLLDALQVTIIDTQSVQIGDLINRLDALISVLDARGDWQAREPLEMHRESIRAAGTFHSQKRVSWEKGKRLLVKAESTLDQAVQIQVIGNIRDAWDQATNIAAAWPLPANDRLTIGFAWDDWQPFIGVDIIVAVAPTAGEIKIYGVVQE